MENYLKEMLVTLADTGVDFVVGGGVACVLHGVERVTLALDVAVEWFDIGDAKVRVVSKELLTQIKTRLRLFGPKMF